MKPLPVDVPINSLLASCFLLASTVLAGPPRSQQHTDIPGAGTVVISGNFSGALQQNVPGSYNFTHGIFLVPEIPLNVDSFISVSIIFDAMTKYPGGNFFQTGVDLRVHNGTLFYQGFLQWGWSLDTYQLLNVLMSPGDYIQLTLMAYNETTGSAFIDNLSTPFGTYSRDNASIYQPDYPLPRQSGGWIIEPELSDYGGSPLAEFGTVSFFGASVGKQGSILDGPPGTTLFILEQDGVNLTSVIPYNTYSLNITRN